MKTCKFSFSRRHYVEVIFYEINKTNKRLKKGISIYKGDITFTSNIYIEHDTRGGLFERE